MRSFYIAKFHLIATAAAGIEALVGKELRALGYETQVENGRVRFEGDLRDIMVANLWLRTADRVKIIVGEFDATDFDSLFEQTKALPWEDLLPIDAAFQLRARVIAHSCITFPAYRQSSKSNR